jgi:hypothetical protein
MTNISARLNFKIYISYVLGFIILFSTLRHFYKRECNFKKCNYSSDKHAQDFIVLKNINKINKRFYTVNEFYPYLNTIILKHNFILKELDFIQSSKENWTLWPEKHLFDGRTEKSTWTIFPFYAFGHWVPQNCEKCPSIYEFIKHIPGLRLATLSKLDAGMKLTPHQGWGNHSNHVIRCHYGLLVPQNLCYISVDDEKQFHCEKEWIIFDDSKTHYANNLSEEDRIILILDIERPYWIEKGISDINDTKELLNIIDYFKSQVTHYKTDNTSLP